MRDDKKILPNSRLRKVMQGLLALRRDHALPDLPKPGNFPKTPEEVAAQSYDDAIRDAFLAFRNARYAFTYLPGVNRVEFGDGRFIEVPPRKERQ